MTDDDTMTSLDDNSDVDLSFAIFDSYLSFTTLSSDLQSDLAMARSIVDADCDVFYDALSDPPSITLYHGIEFFDTASDMPTFPLSWHPPKPPSSWFARLAHWFLLQVFWISTLLWHALIYVMLPDPLPPRRICRSKCPATIRCFPASWILLTHCVMMVSGFYAGNVPLFPIPALIPAVQHVHLCSTAAYERIQHLDTLVVLNGDTLFQYQGIKFQQSMTAVLQARYSKTAEQEVSLTDEELESFFDAYSEFPEATGEYFFEAMTESEDKNVWNLLQLSDICPTSFVECICMTNEDILKQETSDSEIHGPTIIQRGLSEHAFSILATDPHALVSIPGAKQAVIFDTGASLGITYDKLDFDGPLTIPEGDLRLGGMAQGLKIDGIGVVTWTFRNADGSELTIRSQCYYVPNAKVRLLSPQRLFNKAKGVTGKFEGGEESLNL
jgi:hypothetical protein